MKDIVLLGSLDLVLTPPGQTIIDGNMAYSSFGTSGLGVINVSNPTSLSLLSTLDTPGNTVDIAITNHTAYLADMSGGVRIIDVTNSTSPQEVGNFNLNGVAGNVQVVGDRLYATNTWTSNGLLYVYDISNHTSVQYLSAYRPRSGSIKNFNVFGDYAYILPEHSNTLSIYDKVNNRGFYYSAESERITDIAVTENYAYLSGGSSYGNSTSLEVLDVTKLHNARVATLQTLNRAQAVGVSGNTAYVADGTRLQIIDVSDPNSPSIIGNYTGSSTFYYNTISLAPADNLAYLGLTVSQSIPSKIGLEIINITQPNNPVSVGSYVSPVIGQGLDVAVSGNYAFIAALNSVRILNVSDPSAITFVNSLQSAGQFYSVAVQDDMLYTTTDSASLGIHLYNTSNITSLRHVGRYSSSSSYRYLAVSGDYLYTTNNGQVLSIVNVSQASNPTLVSQTSLSTKSGSNDEKLTLAGDLAYVSTGLSGFSVVNISDPHSPVEIGGFDSMSQTHHIAVVGDLAYTAEYYFALGSSMQIFNTSALLNAKISTYIPTHALGTANYVSGLTLDNNTLYLSKENGGLPETVNIADPHMLQAGPKFPDNPFPHNTVGRSISVSNDIIYASTGNAFRLYGFAEAPVLVNHILTINEGETKVLNDTNFLATDNDTPNNALTFTVSNVQHGQFELVANPNNSITTFTQEQINNGDIQFVQDGSESAPSFNVSVSDGNTSTNVTAATIHFTNVNDAPMLVNHVLTISEGETKVLNDTNFLATDNDTPNNALTFTVSNVQHGQFELVANPNNAITTFTQEQINNGDIQFVQDSSESAPSFSVSVSDGNASTNVTAATIHFTNVNDVPVLVNHVLTISEGETKVLNDTNFLATDNDTPNNSLTFTVSNVQHGQFELVANPNNSITTFTQEQVNNGDIQFVQDGNESAPSFNVSVSDGNTSTNVTAAMIHFTNVNDAPMLVNHVLTISEGETKVLNDTNFLATDNDTPNNALTFTVSNVQHGQFELVANPNNAITTFTQEQINNGDIQFVQDSSESAPSFSVSVSDGNASTNVTAATIHFTNVNDAPMLVNQVLTISEGETKVLNDTNFLATDNDTPNNALTFTVSNIQHGQFELVANPNNAITTFTQEQINNGDIQFVQDGSESAPSFSVSVSDGTTSSNTTAATIHFNNVNDAPEIKISLANRTFIEDAKAAAVVPNAIVTDDNEFLQSANATITTNYHEDEDFLTFTDQLGIHGEFNTKSGILSLAGNATVSAYQTALRNISYYHTDDNPVRDFLAVLLQVSDGQLSSNTVTRIIELMAVNDLPRVTKNAFTIVEGETQLITRSNLTAVDPEQTDLLIKVESYDHGYFTLGSAPGHHTSSFSQRQIDNGNITFTHDGSEFAPNFSFNIYDGTVWSGLIPANITFIQVNDAPVLDKAELVISEGETQVMTIDNFLASDSDDNASQLIFNINGLQHGQFAMISQPAQPIFNFTQQEINDGMIEFTHDGSEYAPTFSVVVSDSQLSTNIIPAHIFYTDINNSPTLVNNSLVVAQGATEIITNANIGATDRDLNDNNLLFFVNSLQHGQFESQIHPGLPISSFNQLQIQNRYIQFIHDGSEFAPHYNVRASDGDNWTAYEPANITFIDTNQVPMLLNHSLTVNEGETRIITNQNLAATDSDSQAAALLFTVSEVRHGQFALVNFPADSITQFTQQQVNAGEVQFTHDGSESAPSFRVTVSDGELSTAVIPANITFHRVNEAPMVTQAIPDQRVQEGEDIAVNIDVFTDPDSDALALSALLADGKPLPAWAQINSTTLFGRPTTPGNFSVNVTATDPQAAMASTEFKLEVTKTPIPDVDNTSSSFFESTTNLAIAGGVALLTGLGLFACCKNRKKQPHRSVQSSSARSVATGEVELTGPNGG